ncbi:hypothetical protein AHV09_07535 [Salmonella enterica subsp. enterica]|nr:hypothetical protein [Salmonella enterica subsp. enterica serovar Gombe]
MAKYIVRVELHHSIPQDYDVLHDFMHKHGFSKSLPVYGGYYPLPSAEYYIEHDSFKVVSDYAHISASAATRDNNGYDILFSELRHVTLESNVPYPDQTIRC